MGRSKKPLISKQQVLEVALEMLGKEGTKNFSTRALAARLNINSASLYVHFKSREEIIVGAAKLVIDPVCLPYTGDEQWRTWMLRTCRQLRRVLLDYPELIPTIARYRLHRVSAAQLDDTIARLEDKSLARTAIVPIIEALEAYVIASALHETQTKPKYQTTGLLVGHLAGLARAHERRALSAGEFFDLVCERIIDSIVIESIERG